MKRILLFFSLIMVACGMYAQVKVDDFEAGNKGWTTIETYADIRNNAYKSGINLSEHVLYTERATDAVNWAGVILNNYKQTGYKYVHAYMYRSNANVPNLKIYDSETPVEFVPMNTIVAEQWQDVVFDISEYTSRGTDFLFFMVDRTDITEKVWMLIDEVQLSNDPKPRTDMVSDGYQLIWNADFASGSLPSNWNIEVNGDGGGNQELQYYNASGVSVGKDPQEGKSCMILTARKEDCNGKHFVSGRVNTLGHTYFQYGKIEARIWFPKTANGLWPAFWLMGNDFNQVGWPACGETDIIELGNSYGFDGNQERYFNGASHWGPKWDAHYQDANAIVNSYSVEDGFHIFTCVWTPQKVAMYVDKDAHPTAAPYYEKAIPVSSEDDAPGKYFHKPEFIIFNLAVGGLFPGIQTTEGITALANGPRSMYIDWVRIYQRGDAGESFHSDVPSEIIEELSTGWVNVQGNDVPYMKVLHNGAIYILRNGQLYDINGRIVK